LLMTVEFSPYSGVPNRQPHLAARNQQVVMTYGAGNAVYFTSSNDGGSTWTRPVVVAAKGKMSLGMRRGPRIAISGESIVISAVVGERGGGADGDLIIWMSADGGKTWSAGKAINEVPGSAREGLHSMAAGGKNTLFATWLDLRSKGTTLYGAVSHDGGKTWSGNRLVYASPSGSICECCHPTAVVDQQGLIYVMFRNSLEGNRDMYVVRSDDGGKTFSSAQKVGSGSWKLNACPMDGGSLAVASGGRVATVWRRDGNIFYSGLGGEEELLGSGRQPVVVSTNRDDVIAWTQGKTLMWVRTSERTVRRLDGEAAFVSLVSLPNGNVLLAGERGDSIFVTSIQ